MKEIKTIQNDAKYFINLSVKDILNFAKKNKLGEVSSISIRENQLPKKYKSEFNYEPISLDIDITKENGKVLTYSFSHHGLANISENGKKLYSLDSEERFSAENPELNHLTIAFMKLLAEKNDSTYLQEELNYRKKSWKDVDEKRSYFGAIRSHYKRESLRLLESEGENGKNYKFYANEVNRYTALCDSLSHLKLFQTKCIKLIERNIESNSENF